METLNDVWTRVWHSLNTGQEQGLRWRILHWSLPTKTQLHKWKNTSANRQCPFCSLDETMEYALISCQRLQPLWANVNLLLQKLGHTTVTNLPEARPTFRIPRHNNNLWNMADTKTKDFRQCTHTRPHHAAQRTHQTEDQDRSIQQAK